MAFTDKQQAFINHYLQCWNATEAARRADYSERSIRQIASENLSKPDIRAEIDRRIKEMTMSADEVLIRLSKQARADMADFLEIYPGGRLGTIDLEKAHAAHKLDLIKDFKVTEKGGIEIKLHDAQAALVHIGKHYGLFKDVSKTEDWHDEVLDMLREGRATPDDIRETLGDDLATEFFKQVGAVTVGYGETTSEGSDS